jgi:hypothetical protein
MSLDAYVRCRCIQEGRAKPHPNPELLIVDPLEGPQLREEATDEQWEAHDEWLADACEHQGFAAEEFIGNVWLVEKIRNCLQKLQDVSRRTFPMLLEKVIYDGTHTGDLIEALDVPMLLTEVEAAEKLASRCGEDAPRLREFLKKMHRLGMASLAARNPIQF